MRARRVFTCITIFLSLFLSVLSVEISAQQNPTNTVVPAQLDLQTAMEILLRQNPTLLRDQQNVAIARANVTGSRKFLNPEIELGSESYPVFDSAPGAFLNKQELGISASQVIETGGKRRKRTLVAEQEQVISESDLQNTVRELKLELKRRFYSVVLAHAQNDLAQEILKQFDTIIALNEARYRQGEVSGLELSRIKTERLRFFNDLLDSRLQLKNTKTALLEILGFSDIAAPFDVTEKLSAALVPVSLTELQQTAFQARPDLLAERQTIERNVRQLSLEKTGSMPDVKPSFGYKRDFGTSTFIFGLSVPVPLFNRNQAGVAKVTAQIEQQRQQVQRASLAVRREVLDAFHSMETHAERVRALQDEYVPSARRTREVAQQSYRLGSLDLIELLDSERLYRETLRTFNQTLYDYRAAIFQLEAAVGKEL